MMIWALFNDVMQRIVTLDKWQQRKNLSNRLKALHAISGSKILDFGCGTGLFARVFKKENLDYYGYDIDKESIAYANRLYQNCTFTTSIKHLKQEAPFDLILANCCFHHIDDGTLSAELSGIHELLADPGIFMMIDLLLAEEDPSLLRKLYRKLERGAYIRHIEDYRWLVEKHFTITRSTIERSHLFSFKYSPIYNDLVIFECKKRT